MPACGISVFVEETCSSHIRLPMAWLNRRMCRNGNEGIQDVIEINPEKLKNVLNGVQGVVGDPLDIAAFAILLMGIFTAVIVIHRRQVRMDLKRKRNHAQSRFNRHIGECDLNETDMTTLKKWQKFKFDILMRRIER
jgi:hypothetical protein